MHQLFQNYNFPNTQCRFLQYLLLNNYIFITCFMGVLNEKRYKILYKNNSYYNE